MLIASSPISRLFKDTFSFLVFFYFFTLHADQLSITVMSLSLRLNNFLALLLCILGAFRYHQSVLVLPKKLGYGLGFVGLAIVNSFLFSPFKERCFFFVFWYFFTMLGYVVLPFAFITFWDKKKTLQLYFLSFIAVGVYAFLQLSLSFLGICDPFAEQTINGTIVRPNAFAYEPSYYALYMTPFMVIVNTLYLLQKEGVKTGFKTIGRGWLLFVNTLYLISTSTGSFFAYGVFLVVLFLCSHLRGVRSLAPNLRSKCLRFGRGLVLFFLALSLCFPWIVKQYFMKFFYYGFMMHASFYERWVGIYNSWKVFLQHPIVGVGLGGAPPFLHAAWQRLDPQFLFFPREWEPKYTDNILKLFEPSNVLSEILASLGIIGFIAFAYLLSIFLLATVQSFKNPNISKEDQCGIFLFSLSLVVTLIVLQFNQGVLRTYIWVHFSLGFATIAHAYLTSESSYAKDHQRLNLSLANL